jgi:uncharacterized membrane protein (UPF0182 family)
VPPTTVSTEPRRSRARALVPTILIVVALAWLYAIFTGVWTDHLWFQSLGFHQVFLTQLGTKVGLAVAFGLVMGAVVGLTVWLVLRFQSAQPTSRAGEAYGPLLQKYRKLATLVPAVVFAVFGGMSGSSNVETFLAWLKQAPVGTQDARFGMDIGFYLFDYPWYRAVVSFALVTLGIATALAAFGHFALGTLAAPGRGKRITSRAAHRHVAILLAAFFVVYAVSKFLDRYGQLLTQGDLLDGLTYTGDHARVSASLIMAAVSLLTAALFLYSCVRPGWMVPITSVALMIVTSLIVGMIYPAAMQSFKVNPNQADTEQPYIEMNIKATRAAYGIEDIEIADYSATTDVAPGQLKDDAETLPGIRLIDPALASQTFTQLQQVRTFYSVSDVLDVDRYTIDGRETDVVLAAREIDQSRLENKDWNNLHTVYTHGYGLVASYGNRLTASGLPTWLAYDIPNKGELVADQQRIYFGERTQEYAIVGRAEGEEPVEFDTPEENLRYTYDGTLGVPMGGLFNRLLYATKFASLNMLLSERINENSQILYDREPKQRVELVAPYLTVDSDAYPALVDGRIVWIVDAYTTSSTYPNSKQTSISEATADTRTTTTLAGLRPADELNYIRNSVKATVDAYTGEVTLYQWDDADPVLQTWMNVYPDTVRPKSDIPQELLAHLRYPSDLFKIQRQVIDQYHVTSAQDWFVQSERWAVPADPVKSSTNAKEPAYYLSIRWPEVTTAEGQVAADEEPLFSLTTVYTPYERQNLAAYMSVVAEATSPDYGQIRVLRMPDQQQIEGPGQAFNSLDRDSSVADALLPYKQDSSLRYGNLLTLPLGGGLLYVEPVYSLANTEGSSPILRFVVVRFGTHTAIATTLQGALDELFKGDAGAETGENEPEETPQPGATPSPGATGTAAPTTGPSPSTSAAPVPPGDKDAVVKAELQEAETQFVAAQKALDEGDLGAYQEANRKAAEAIQRALDAMG